MARIPFRIDLVKPNTKFVVVKETTTTEIYPARVLCTDLKGTRGEILVAYEKIAPTGVYECIQQFTCKGVSFGMGTLSLWIDAPETWILRKKDGYGSHFYVNNEYSSKEAAQRMADKYGNGNFEVVRVVTE